MSDDDNVVFLRPDDVGSVRATLLAEALEDTRQAIRRYHDDPSDGTWQLVIDALTNVLGDTETYQLLGAIASRVRR